MLIIEIHVDEYETKNSSTRVLKFGEDAIIVEKGAANLNGLYKTRDFLEKCWRQIKENHCKSNGL